MTMNLTSMAKIRHSPPTNAHSAFYAVVACIPVLHTGQYAGYLLSYDDVKQCHEDRKGIQHTTAHIRHGASITPRQLDMMTFSYFAGHKRADIQRRIATEKRSAAMLNTLPRRRIQTKRRQYAADSDKCVIDLHRRLVLTDVLGTSGRWLAKNALTTLLTQTAQQTHW